MSLTPPAAAPVEAAATLDGFAVLDACHRQSLLALGRLADLMAAIDRQHDADPATRAAVGSIVEFFSTTVSQHHKDEEQHVFPKLLLGDDPEIVQAVLRLQQDHHWMDVDWMELSPMLTALASGRGGYDPDALREGLEIFSGLLRDHIALEESCIYPQARRQMRPAELQAMGREMARRHHARRRGATGDRSER